MSKITLFLMNQKGHQLLVGTVQRYGKLIDRIVIGKDAALDNDYSAAIEAVCLLHKIPYAFRDASVTDVIETEYAMAVGWRWMIDFPQDRLIVFHDSLLPKYRGFNPLVTALINGDAETGVTALLGSDRYDAGPILAQARMPLTYPITIAQATEQIGQCYIDAAVSVFQQIADGAKLTGTPQDESAASYSLWRDNSDYRVDWSRPAEEIARMVDAVGSPYAGAETKFEGTRAKIGKATALPDVEIANRAPGKIIWMEGVKPVVVCGTGLLRLDELWDQQTAESIFPLPKFRLRFD